MVRQIHVNRYLYSFAIIIDKITGSGLRPFRKRPCEVTDDIDAKVNGDNYGLHLQNHISSQYY